MQKGLWGFRGSEFYRVESLEFRLEGGSFRLEWGRGGDLLCQEVAFWLEPSVYLPVSTRFRPGQRKVSCHV